MGGADHCRKVVKKVKETKTLCVCVCDCKISPEDIVNSSRFQQATSHSNFAPLLSTKPMLIFYLILVTVL